MWVFFFGCLGEVFGILYWLGFGFEFLFVELLIFIMGCELVFFFLWRGCSAIGFYTSDAECYCVIVGLGHDVYLGWWRGRGLCLRDGFVWVWIGVLFFFVKFLLGVFWFGAVFSA
jgi:hypothetical protein